MAPGTYGHAELEGLLGGMEGSAAAAGVGGMADADVEGMGEFE